MSNNLEAIEPRYCEDAKCHRKVLPPYIYCDTHQDKSSTPIQSYELLEDIEFRGQDGKVDSIHYKGVWYYSDEFNKYRDIVKKPSKPTKESLTRLVEILLDEALDGNNEATCCFWKTIRDL